MHHPPEVRLLVGGSPWPRRLALLIGTLALLQVSWFSSLNWTPSWQMAAVVTSLLLALAWAWLWMRQRSKGELHWDGIQWRWSGFADGECLLQRHLDFQTLMLVSLHRPTDRPVWLWLQRSHGPRQWLALRRAVVHAISPAQAHRTQGSTQSHQTAIP